MLRAYEGLNFELCFVFSVDVEPLLLNSGHGGFFANCHKQFVKGGPP